MRWASGVHPISNFRKSEMFFKHYLLLLGSGHMMYEQLTLLFFVSKVEKGDDFSGLLLQGGGDTTRKGESFPQEKKPFVDTKHQQNHLQEPMSSDTDNLLDESFGELLEALGSPFKSCLKGGFTIPNCTGSESASRKRRRSLCSPEQAMLETAAVCRRLMTNNERTPTRKSIRRIKSDGSNLNRPITADGTGFFPSSTPLTKHKVNEPASYRYYYAFCNHN